MGNCFIKTSSSGSLSRKPAGGKVGSVLQKPVADVRSLFHLERKLGKGQFGTTYLCTERATGLRYACKSVSKRKLVRRVAVDDMRREITILQHLSGQPNIAEFKGAFEDSKYVHVVMELCSGGDLFDRITAKGSYSERQAAAVCRDILTVVHVCHFMGVMHRDLKPENFLLASAAEDAELKAIDFGVSVFIEEGKVYKDIVGTASYMAPEVLQQNYGKEIDVWSAGVILYILLCGTPPFWARKCSYIFSLTYYIVSCIVLLIVGISISEQKQRRAYLMLYWSVNLISVASRGLRYLRKL